MRVLRRHVARVSTVAALLCLSVAIVAPAAVVHAVHRQGLRPTSRSAHTEFSTPESGRASRGVSTQARRSPWRSRCTDGCRARSC